jgi:hypothetical protein
MVIKYQQSSIDLQSQRQSKASVCTAMLVGHSEDRSSMLRLENKSIVDRERLPAATYVGMAMGTIPYGDPYDIPIPTTF